MMNTAVFTRVTPLALLLATLVASPLAQAGAELNGGVWWVYQYADDNPLDTETGGEFGSPAFIAYADDDGSHGPWHFSAEARWGTGSFTDPVNNDSGDQFTVHKAWIGYDLSEQSSLKIGKSQVPFGWKTVNFWPGDGLQGGYGDQMDVGLKLSSEVSDFHYDLAYYHQDDFGGTSTDTVDDNGHWGSSDAYRKIKTVVANGDWNFLPGHTLGVSYQNGRMQDLAAVNPNDNGRHQGVDVHYVFELGDFYAKYRFIDIERDFSGMDGFLALPVARLPSDDEVENQRHIVELGYTWKRWFFYVDAGSAESDTRGNDDQGEFYAPGLSYKYGPGWLYLEYLWQNAGVDRNGDIAEGDFSATYVSFDFYF